VTPFGCVRSSTGFILAVTLGTVGLLPCQAMAQAERASVAGVVRLDDAPVVGAVVTLGGAGLTPPRVVITDPGGRFMFANVVPGDFALAVRKPPYVLSSLDGAMWIGDDVPIALATGRRVELSLGLGRGGAIDGVIRDPFGQPLSGATVGVFRKRRDPSTTPAPPVTSVRTDGRGHYRVHGLRPGEYVVRASAPTSFGSLGMELVDDVDFRNVERAARESRSIAPRPPGDQQAVQYMPAFFSGTAAEKDAVTVTVEAGREQLGVDIPLALSRTVTLRGVVTDSDGRPAPASRVSLFPDQAGLSPVGSTVVAVDREGRFVKDGVPPGPYRVVAQTTSARGAVETGAVDVQVPGSENGTIALVTARAATLQGRLVLEEGDRATRTKILKSARVTLQRVGRGIVISSLDVAQAQVNETGVFGFTGILPGSYALTLDFPGFLDVERPGLEFMEMEGARLPDGIVPVSPSPEDILELHVSTRQAELSGTVVGWRSGAGGLLSVLVFPVEPAAWRRSANRIRMVQVQASGSYQVKGVAAGAYFVALVSGVDESIVIESSTFEEAARMAIRVEVVQGDVRMLNLRVGQR
jgi:protocatechuate 3,4-dioxygenase beta subunit